MLNLNVERMKDKRKSPAPKVLPPLPKPLPKVSEDQVARARAKLDREEVKLPHRIPWQED